MCAQEEWEGGGEGAEWCRLVQREVAASSAFGKETGEKGTMRAASLEVLEAGNSLSREGPVRKAALRHVWRHRE